LSAGEWIANFLVNSLTGCGCFAYCAYGLSTKTIRAYYLYVTSRWMKVANFWRGSLYLLFCKYRDKKLRPGSHPAHPAGGKMENDERLYEAWLVPFLTG
jgi:hypothetical protein